MEEKVTFETAKLAKKKKFDEYCRSQFNTEGKSMGFTGYCYMKEYNKNSKIHLVDNNTWESEEPKSECTQPTQSVLQKWLRDNHNIIIDIYDYYNENDLPLSNKKFPKPKGYFYWDKYNDNFSEEKAIKFKTYEKALEYGLKKGLKLIK